MRRQQNKAFKSWRNVRRGPETSLSPEIMYDGTKNGFVVPGVTYSGTKILSDSGDVHTDAVYRPRGRFGMMQTVRKLGLRNIFVGLKA